MEGWSDEKLSSTSRDDRSELYRMEGGNGKLFVGGISWDTNEDCLREHFESFGEVVEAVILKNRITGRARGFGFVVFSDPLVADRVVKEKHVIGGRTVDAKKAVPRDGPDIISRNNGSAQNSPGPTRTKKIFVGGLPSTITECDFKKYFDQFGTTTDVVLMYDHNTKRARGFGFVTYDSEAAVDIVLVKKFHELNGKLVEVKRAVPKELSPGTSLSPLRFYTDGLDRANNLYNVHTQVYNLNSVGGHGVRMDGRFSPLSVSRTGYLPVSPSGYDRGPILDSGLASSYGGGGAFTSTTGYGQELNTYFRGDSNRFKNPIRYNFAHGGSNIYMNPTKSDAWSTEIFCSNPASSNNVIGSSRSINTFDAFRSASRIWGSTPVLGQGGRTRSFSSDTIHYPREESSISRGVEYGSNGIVRTGATTSHTSGNNFSRETFDAEYGSGSFYRDSSRPFADCFGNSAPGVTSTDNTVGYSVSNRAYRGITT